MVNQTYKLKVDGIAKTCYRGEDFGFFKSVSSLNNLFFSVAYNSSNGPNGALAEDNGIYWIDNVTVEPTVLKVTGQSPSENESGVAIKKNSAVITFNDKIDVDNAAEFVTIYANGEEVSADNYTVNAEINKISIAFNEELSYETEYEITVSKDLNSNNIDLLQLKEDYILTFTTNDFRVSASGNTIIVRPVTEMTDGSVYKIWLSHKIAGRSGLTLMSPREITFTTNLLDPFRITKQIQGTVSAGQTLEAAYSVENISNSDEWLAVVLICYDKDKAITGTVAVNKNVPSGETVKLAPSITVPENSDSAFVYVWRSRENGTITMHPVAEPYEIK